MAPENTGTRVMHAAFIDSVGPPECIHFGELPVPQCGPTDVLIRVFATAVDPVDTLIRSGQYRTPLPFPFVIGRDLVGEICECGSSIVRARIGERVWCNSLGHAGRQGAAAEYAVVAEDRIYPLPQAVDPLHAVAVAHPAATAYLALLHGRLTAGEHVLIAGGAGNVGAAAIVLAREAGAHVISTAAAADLDYCRSVGAEVAIDYRAPDLIAQLKAELPAGVNLHVDTSGQPDLLAAIELLAIRGRIVLLAARQATAPLPIRPLYTRDGSITGFAISNAATSELAAAAMRINELLARGTLRPRAIELLPLSAAAEAHRRLERGGAHGLRLVLQP